jgi:prepilin-type N-terminal cleavage/methylation domain-containing protein
MRRRPLKALQASRGFTLVEAMVAISLAALAGSALLLQLNSTTQSTEYALKETMAMGMAQQLLDEALGVRYCSGTSTAHQTTLAPSGSSTGSRQSFSVSGDFNGYRRTLPVDPYGVTLGLDDGVGGQRPAAFRASTNRYAQWRQEVDVTYVSESNWSAPAAASNDYRAVEVRIMELDPQRGSLLLAKVRRVIAYVPPL